MSEGCIGIKVPVRAIIVQIPKRMDNNSNIQAVFRRQTALYGNVLTISFVNVMLSAKIPVDSVINCFARSLAN